jgi:hypothetical protein
MRLSYAPQFPMRRNLKIAGVIDRRYS